jgi:hypothetical protein
VFYYALLDVSPTHLASLGEFWKLPAILGASNPGLTEPASIFVIKSSNSDWTRFQVLTF